MQAKGIRHNTGSPSGDCGMNQLATRERKAGLTGMAERLVVLVKPGNSGGGKEPQLKADLHVFCDRACPKPEYRGTMLETEVSFMERIRAQFVGVELYFEDLETAKRFYIETLGLEVSDEQGGHHAKFDGGAGFVCLERKGAESYPSKDKAVLFFEVPNLRSAVAAIGQDRLVQSERTWAVLHDPEGHNILLLERPS
jgi:catechol 2,3-dioxygenase-like lactoylglutathione lyase family enzyme